MRLSTASMLIEAGLQTISGTGFVVASLLWLGMTPHWLLSLPVCLGAVLVAKGALA